ncbi:MULTISPECIES: hypothetical protein [Bacillus]|uniref:Uncharacterized protein n=1 Tax=Bacillus pumilus TaxID=1408 RepID=A0A2G8IUK1_BACPU|nr:MULTISPECIES: hypothetical protein [Bacillus]MCC9089944.1 hypothetical protein [Bacillus pumilus]MED1748532.1 hypothetical protein [Bacillus zhangzhouensis]PIK27167.1 hypothetical protein CTV99_09155 [Bacillus pumilus]UUD42680.1 hypothetical protein NPA43_18140 [Bacillus pumilus]
MYKVFIPTVVMIFILWILLQLSFHINIFHNPMNYFIVITLFFLCIQALLKHRQ